MKKMLPCLMMAVMVLCCPNMMFAQAVAPPLGTAANFVLFSTDGAVTNGIVISNLTGNVGTNNGGLSGFHNVNGQMHNNDGATAQAAADLLIAYNQLNSTIANFSHAPLLGGGDTLISGVYNIGGTASLDGDLFLDAKGNANAVFIFKINGAFSTSAASKIKLINGALACNVFWKVEGKVDMATATFMRGTIIANNAEIVMSVNDTLEGRALSTTGAVTVNGVLAYTPIGCGSITLTGPAAPVLGSTACYALFSGSGAVANGGVTHVTGDIGTNFGMTSGFDPLLVTGTIHAAPDPSTEQCAIDLQAVYNYLNLLPADIELLYPAEFGNDLVLTPHTYLMNAAAAFTGSVFLDAQGNTDAVFVIKVNGALSTATYSKVILRNGTQAKNVYWLVEGAVNIMDYSIFNGTVVANSGVLTLSTGTTINGRAFATNRALNTAAIIATSPSGACAPLPVTWLFFRGKPVQQNVLLEWGTSNEISNGFFTLEKSRDGQHFETLATVNATKAFGTAEHDYSFTDNRPYPLTYYSISQTDIDGQKKHYNTIQVKLTASTGFKERHYVMSNYIYVETTDALPGKGSIELYSIDGKKMFSQKIILGKEVQTYKIDKSLVAGMYLLYIQNNGEKIYNGKVMVF